MKLSNYFLPLTKEIPSDAILKSHILMLRAGMIMQNTQGIYTLLPMGYKVVKKIENIIQKNLDKIGGIRLSMPTIQPQELWQKSERIDAYGLELLRIKDRHNKDLLYSPTNEEMIVDIFKNYIKSYKNLPLALYQINWKFRDEIRPRFGLMRAREFLMMDAYSFHENYECAEKTYNKYYEAYLNIFKEIGLSAIAMKADSGQIGGDMSHEFQILAPSGESKIFYDSKLDDELNSSEINIEKIKNFYAVTEEKFDKNNCPIPENQIKETRGIEVGHIFYLGNKYTKIMNVNLLNKDNQKFIPLMCTFGIGVTRIMASAIEVNNDDKGIIWSKKIAPFDIIIINLDPTSEKCNEISNKIYKNLQEEKFDIILDDTEKSPGEKFASADLIGIPLQLIIGIKNLNMEVVEIKKRHNNEKILIKIDKIYDSIREIFENLY